jgi:hypothetical protein
MTAVFGSVSGDHGIAATDAGSRRVSTFPILGSRTRSIQVGTGSLRRGNCLVCADEPQ